MSDLGGTKEILVYVFSLIVTPMTYHSFILDVIQTVFNSRVKFKLTSTSEASMFPQIRKQLSIVENASVYVIRKSGFIFRRKRNRLTKYFESGERQLEKFMQLDKLVKRLTQLKVLLRIINDTRDKRVQFRQQVFKLMMLFDDDILSEVKVGESIDQNQDEARENENQSHEDKANGDIDPNP